MHALIHAFDGHQAQLEFLPESLDEAGQLEAYEQGLAYGYFEQLRQVVNAALQAAGQGHYFMQLYQGRQGRYHVVSVQLAPRAPSAA
jgi:hypothetical protein